MLFIVSKSDAAILAGVFLILSVGVYAYSGFQIPGTDNKVTNPVGEGKHTLNTEIVLAASALGNADISQFKYETSTCQICLSFARTNQLAAGGVNSVTIEHWLRDSEGNVRVHDVVSLRETSNSENDEIGAGQSKRVPFEYTNLEPGTYEVEYFVTWNPDIWNIKDNKDRIVRNVEVPRN